jgi:hypothetical protein
VSTKIRDRDGLEADGTEAGRPGVHRHTAAERVDDERYVDDARPGHHVPEVGDQRRFGPVS